MRTMLMVLVLVGAVAGCGTAAEPDPSSEPSPDVVVADPMAAMLPADAVRPAPPGTAVVDDLGAVVVDEVDVPTVQQQPCSMLEPTDVPGPPEPDAVSAAVGGFVTGVVQVDQRAVVYRDEAAAAAALERARAQAQDCDAALQLHSTSDLESATASLADPPAGVEGFQLTVARQYPGGPSTSESAVLRSGTVVLSIQAVETGAPAGEEWAVDGVVDPAWAQELMDAAAGQLSA